MKKIEFVYEEILQQTADGNRRLTQSQLSKKLGLSLSMVSLAIRPLRRMGAVEVKPRGLKVSDPKKVLLYWASIRNVQKDIVYSTRAEMSVADIEKNMPHGIVFTAYSAYRMRFGDAPADYSEVYVYGDAEEVRKRFPPSMNTPNIFVLKAREAGRQAETAGNPRMFVDLWNLGTWYAKDFLKALEVKLGGVLE
jgi:hypothetical protein